MGIKNCKKVFSDLKTKLHQLKSELENISEMFVEIAKSLNDTIEIGNKNKCFSGNLKAELRELVIQLNRISINEDKDINVQRSINLIIEILNLINNES